MATLFRRGHNDAAQARKALDVHFPPYRDGDGAAALARQVAALDVRDTEAVAGNLPHLKIPARLAWGAADRAQKLRYGERLAQDLNAPLRRIDGGKHFTPEDHPDITAEEINLLLRDIRAQPASPHSAVGSEGGNQ